MTRLASLQRIPDQTKFLHNINNMKQRDPSILDFLFINELGVCTVDLYGLIRAPLLNLHSHGLANAIPMHISKNNVPLF